MKKDPDICWEAYMKKISKVRALIKKGVDIESRDRDKRTALLNAVTGSDINLALVKLLVKNKANVNAQDSDGFSALHFCAEENQIEIAEYLLKKGAEVDLKDIWGNTPLMRALNSCYVAMGYNMPSPGALIELFLKAGADRNAVNNYGVKVIDMATECDRDLIQFFNEKK